MSFSLDSWQLQIKKSLESFLKRPQATLKREGIKSPLVYLVAKTLHPLASELNQDPFAASMALLNSVGAANGDQIAKYLQAKGKEAFEPQFVETQLHTSTDFRVALNKLLVAMNLFGTLQTNLTRADWAWLQECLLGELASYKETGEFEQLTISITSKGDVAVSGSKIDKSHAGVRLQNSSLVKGDVAGRDIINTFITIYQQNVEAKASREDYETAIEHYIEHILNTHVTLNLRGIRSNQPINVEIESIYISLFIEEQAIKFQKDRRTKVAEEPRLASVNEALQNGRRLVILGGPGSGKTTCLSYLALTFARAIKIGSNEIIHERLGIRNETLLPIFLPLREFGRFVRSRSVEERVGPNPALLLDYLSRYFERWRLRLPSDFFERQLEQGRCILLLDGLDEVADLDERILVSEAVSAFIHRYSKNRFVVTSRVRGYEGAARLGSEFHHCTISDLQWNDVETFVKKWSLAVESSQVQGDITPSLRIEAERKATELLAAISSNPRIRQLAVNPLLLTVIALVHRYRATLPQRRAELYEECTEVLLGYWERGKSGEAAKELAEYAGEEMAMDAGEKRSFLEPIALWLHENEKQEASEPEMVVQVAQQFINIGLGETVAQKRGRDFLRAVTLRSGLLQEVEQGIYRFSHLTFQEYLAARIMAGRLDFVNNTLRYLDEAWWKEVILLEAGHLSTTGGRDRANQLIRAIFETSIEGRQPERLILTAQCLADIGKFRVDGELWDKVTQTLLQLIEQSNQALSLTLRVAWGNVLGDLGDPRPGAIVEIPAGPFLMGINQFGPDEQPQRQVQLPVFMIDRYPVTNDEYKRFVEETGHRLPKHWEGGTFPPGKANHPVVNVSWHDATAYSKWTGKRLPTEAEWEKAARGTDGQLYPWGNDFSRDHCNVFETGLQSTTPVGLFPTGVSPYGVYDMAGNVWEWTADWFDAGKRYKVLRGSSWLNLSDSARCTYRSYYQVPDRLSSNIGFRCVEVGSSKQEKML